MSGWLTAAAVMGGGALGALARWLASSWISGVAPRGFPWATLLVNVLGSLAIGVLYALLVRDALVHPVWRHVTMTGLLGAFTTFSAFALEAVLLLQDGRWTAALLYVAASTTLCVGAAACGIRLVS